MPYVVADRVKETSTSTGTGNFTLAGAATGFRTFNSGIGVGNTTTYVITDATGSQWEVGLGTLSGTTTLVRTYVFSNSAGTTSQINFSAGTKSVFVSMSAAPRNFNVVLGTASGFSPDLYSNNTVIGYAASSGGDGNTAVGYTANASGSDALAIGINSTASAFASVAVGRTSSASNTGATAVGPGANASAFQSTAIGNDANVSNNGATSVGYGANSSANSGVAVGYAASAPPDGSNPGAIAIGGSAVTNGGVTIGYNSTASTKFRTTIIGNGITALQDDATYMNKFRTGVTPVGTAWYLKWDDSTKEVYADPGPGPSTPNWYAYQDAGFGTTLSVALPAATPTSYTSGTNNWLQWSNPFTPSNWASFGSYSFGGTLYVHYGSSYPLPDPTAGSTGYGFAVSYYAGYPSDSGTTSTYEVYTGSSVWSNFGSSVNLPGFSLFGGPPSRVGHAIILLSGNYSTPVPDTGVTVLETAYDSYNNVTYVFVDVDAPKVAALGFGSSPNLLTSFGGTTSYNVLFWYNYA